MAENADEEYIPVELESITYEIGEDGVRQVRREVLATARITRAQLEAPDFDFDAEPELGPRS
jgi:hypothetical protein